MTRLRVPVRIRATAEYLPERVVDNRYFSELTGRAPIWFEERTGIQERRRAAPSENSNTMAISAVENLLAQDPRALEGVDLIVGASYTPWDTIGTLAHVVQRRFNIANARALYVSTACSSFIDAVEIAASYFESGRARTALVIAVEHNSLYSKDSDDRSGHLWGDGAAVMVLTTEPAEDAVELVDVIAMGRGDLGYGPEGIGLVPGRDGLVMQQGKDIFVHACREMVAATRSLAERSEIEVEDLSLIVMHQANKRILDRAIDLMSVPSNRVPVTIDKLGNTGCAGVAITYGRYSSTLPRGGWAALVTFGGGYSVGAALLRRPG